MTVRGRSATFAYDGKEHGASGYDVTADVPFYDYLWQFYAQNRKKVRSIYTPLTRKFLDFNDPGAKEADAFLRRPQFEALEMYVFLKEYCDNAKLSAIFQDWYKRTGPFDGRGTFRLKIGELGLFETLDAAERERVAKWRKHFLAGGWILSEKKCP